VRVTTRRRVFSLHSACYRVTASIVPPRPSHPAITAVRRRIFPLFSSVATRRERSACPSCCLADLWPQSCPRPGTMPARAR
jgi:hypothetical protein